MIGRLAFAQLRAHRAQTAWLAALLTVLAGIVTAILVMGATQARLADAAADAVRGDGDRRTFVQATLGEAPDGWTDIRPEEAAAAAAATRSGWVVAEAQLLTEEPVSEDWAGIDSLRVMALSDARASAGLITVGNAPEHLGEIAISADLAAGLDVAIGDTVTLWRPRWTGFDQDTLTEPFTFTVVGFTYSPALPGYDVWDVPAAVVSWNEATTSSGVLVSRDSFDEVPVDVVSLDVTWSGASPVLDAYLFPGENWSEESGSIALPNSTGPWLGAVVALVAAMVIMSFAVGRSQAATRTQWVATTRTLGASRSYVAAATVLETGLIAVVALVAGTALGVGAAQAHLSVARALVSHPLGTPTVSVHEATVPIVAGVLAIVAVVVAAIPAFWASRVPPAAALKPVNDITEAELSRRVSVWWLWIPFIAGMLTALWAREYADFGLAAVVWIGWIAVFVTGLGLVIEATRRAIPAVGRRLARSHRPALIAAGDSLRLRPRQAVAPSLIMTAAATVATVVLSSSVEQLTWVLRAADAYPSREEAIRWAVADATSPVMFSSVLVVALATQGVAAAIATSHRASVTRETGALRALGLSAADERRAFWWQQWVPQVVGLVAGVAVGFVLSVATAALSSGSWETGGFGSFLALRSVLAAVPIAVVAVAVLSLAAAVAWVVARATTRPTAVAALRPPS